MYGINLLAVSVWWCSTVPLYILYYILSTDVVKLGNKYVKMERNEQRFVYLYIYQLVRSPGLLGSDELCGILFICSHRVDYC